MLLYIRGIQSLGMFRSYVRARRSVSHMSALVDNNRIVQPCELV